MYQEILSIGGHTISLAETAAEALAAISQARPDVILLDLGIAGGVDAVVASARAEPQARVILASGARDLPEKAEAIGAAAHLTKPFMPEQLLVTLEKVLKA